ncbi:hypothetical protein NUSPORA_01003 [Nucleospora cyclopteri]
MAGNKIISDDFGLSFEVKQDEIEITGLDCIETNSRAVAKIASILQTSLGPNGMDKIILDSDNKITMTNDGATIVAEYVANNAGCVMELIKQLSSSQDNEIGDGTTSIIIFANSLMKEALSLLKQGIHPIKITEGFNEALNYAIGEIQGNFADNIEDKPSFCLKAVETCLNSKIASFYKNLPKVCVDAVYSVADMERRDVDLDKINVKILKGGSMNQTELINGVLLEKEIVGEIAEGQKMKIALLACPFEPPKLKNKNKMLVSSVGDYKKLSNYEQTAFYEMIQKVKNSGADLVLCQWGFDDEATSMLMENKLPAVRWVGGHELGHIAALINAQIVSRFENLDSSCLGEGFVEITNEGTENEVFIKVTAEKNTISTIAIKSSNKFVSEEIERSIKDSLCAARNVLIADKIVYGGGSLEMNLYKTITNVDGDNNHITNLLEAEELCCFKAFATALLEIPFSLSRNAGHNSNYVENVISTKTSGVSHYGVAAFDGKLLADMKAEGVFESLESKTRQLKMATDFVNTILKISDVIKK